MPLSRGSRLISHAMTNPLMAMCIKEVEATSTIVSMTPRRIYGVRPRPSCHLPVDHTVIMRVATEIRSQTLHVNKQFFRDHPSQPDCTLKKSRMNSMASCGSYSRACVPCGRQCVDIAFHAFHDLHSSLLIVPYERRAKPPKTWHHSGDAFRLADPMSSGRKRDVPLDVEVQAAGTDTFPRAERDVPCSLRACGRSAMPAFLPPYGFNDKTGTSVNKR